MLVQRMISANLKIIKDKSVETFQQNYCFIRGDHTYSFKKKPPKKTQKHFLWVVSSLSLQTMLKHAFPTLSLPIYPSSALGISCHLLLCLEVAAPSDNTVTWLKHRKECVWEMMYDK